VTKEVDGETAEPKANSQRSRPWMLEVIGGKGDAPWGFLKAKRKPQFVTLKLNPKH